GRMSVMRGLGGGLGHGRAFAFANGGARDYNIGWADWRPGNRRRRVEVAAPIRDAPCRPRLDRILEAELADPTAWELGPDGGYYHRAAPPGGAAASAQERLMRLGEAAFA